MPIRTDKRTIEAQRDPDAIAAVEEGAARLNALHVELARAFAQVAQTSAFVYEGAASLFDLALRVGYERPDARWLAAAGRAMATCPELARRIGDGSVGLHAAAVLEPVLTRPELVEETDRWLDDAGSASLRDLRRRVRKRLAELDQKEATVEIAVHVTPDTRDAFDRARRIASRKAGRILSDSQVFSLVVAHYLKSFDEALKKPRARRASSTVERPDDRDVPAEVRREIYRRSGDRCEVPGCPNQILRHLAHLVPHRVGSGREAFDLLDLCRMHHTQYDAGLLRLEPRGNGVWEFMSNTGRSLGTWSPSGKKSATGRGPTEEQPSSVSESASRWELLPASARLRPMRC